MKEQIRPHHRRLVDENAFQHVPDSDLFHNPEIPNIYGSYTHYALYYALHAFTHYAFTNISF